MQYYFTKMNSIHRITNIEINNDKFVFYAFKKNCLNIAYIF